MHILFVGYGKTSQKLAKPLFEQGHQITTISLSPKTDPYATHLTQDVHALNLQHVADIDVVYVLLSPKGSSKEAYQLTYLNSVPAIVSALEGHPVKRIIVLSSTRVYGENQGEVVNDETPIHPQDSQGQILYDMERAYLKAFGKRCVIVRPSGIYGNSVVRLQKMAYQYQHYPNLHWSNRIHSQDLVRFLIQLLHVEHTDSSYILTNNQPVYLHEILRWFQKQMFLPLLKVESDHVTGKRLYATRIKKLSFELKHQDCYQDYLALMHKKN
jgi:nucleoside-diphosphate-sugar epimerase